MPGEEAREERWGGGGGEGVRVACTPAAPVVLFLGVSMGREWAAGVVADASPMVGDGRGA